MFGRIPRIGVGICVHNEEEYIEYCLKSVYDFADVIAVSVNTGLPWSGNPEPLDRTLETVKTFPDPKNKIRIQAGEWDGEISQRNANADLIRDAANYYMIVDADEIYSRCDLDRIREFVRWRLWIGQFRIRMNTYWKIRPVFRIDPPEPLKAYMLTRLLSSTRFVGLRKTNEKLRCVIPRRIATMHHFSYARPDERILQKIRNFSHRDEMVRDWYERVWLGWDSDHSMTDLHPTHPPEYKRAVVTDIGDLPEVMRAHPFVIGSTGNKI